MVAHAYNHAMRKMLVLLLACVGCGGSTEEAGPGGWLEAEFVADQAAWTELQNESNGVWVGRRLGYLGRHDEAVDWYRQMLERFPESYRLRRHLGHRLISTRHFEEAIVVLERARLLAADHPNYLEADGAPNPTGEPRSTTHGNIDYHLGLAYYLVGRFDEAADSWRRCVENWARNDDGRVSAGHWWYTSLVRGGHPEEAQEVLEVLPSVPEVIENFAYRDLIDLYAGRRTEENSYSAAWQYGLARWKIANGNVDVGMLLLAELAKSESRNSFGVIAAEADLAR